MKRLMISGLILMLLGFGVPCASAEISQDLDPMVPVDPQTIVTDESSVNGTRVDSISNVVSTADAAMAGEKSGEKKKEKSKKNSAEKSFSKNKKSGKADGNHSPRQTKKRKKISY